MKKIGIVLLILIGIMINDRLSFALDDNDMSIVEDYYDTDYIGYYYPVLPQTNQWPYGDHQKMVDICQIPKEDIDSINTEALLQTVLNYPLIGDILAYDDLEAGYNIVKEHFFALAELAKRPDKERCIKLLMDKYENVDENEHKKMSEFALYRRNFRKFMLNVLKMQNDFGNLDWNIKNVETKVLSNSLKRKMINVSYVAFVGFDDQYKGKIIVGRESIYTQRYGMMTGYIMNAMEVWRGSDGNYYLRQLDDLSNEAKTILNNNVSSTYGLTPVSGYGPTVKYNCHSYAWYRQSNCNYWVDSFSTTNYTQVSKQNVNIGGKAVFYNTFNNGQGTVSGYSHSAIIYSRIINMAGIDSFIMKSKWGMEALYIHALENCPYYYAPNPIGNQQYPCDMRYYN